MNSLFTRSIYLILAWCLASVAIAQQPEASQSAPSQSAEPRKRDISDSQGVVVGIEGHYRLGHLTAVRLTSEALKQDHRRGDLRLVTRDGDGNDVSYSSYPPFDSTLNADRELGYVAVGVEAAPLALFAVGSAQQQASGDGAEADQTSATEQVILETRFPEAGNPLRGPALIPSQMPWVVSIGDPLGIDKLGTSNVMVDQLGSIAVTDVQSAASLPWSAVGYSGVDMVLINSSGLGILQQMKPAQHQALVSWLGQGGRVMVCLGQYAPEMLKVAPWIRDAIGLTDLRMDRYDPADFESFTVSSTRLSDFAGLRLPKKRGRMLVAGKTTRRVSAPLVASYVYGFGVLTAITADFDRAPFDDWRVRDAMILAFNFEYINDTANAGRQERITSYFSNSKLGLIPGPAQGAVRDLLLPFADDVLPGALDGYSLPKGDGSERNRSNMRRAADMLAQAGYSVENGDLISPAGTPVSFDILLRQGAQEYLSIIEIYSQALARLGIKANITLVDGAQYAERSRTLDFDMMPFARDLSLSPGNEQYLYWSSEYANTEGTRNMMGMASPAMDAMLDKIMQAKTLDELNAVTRAMDRILMAGRYVIPIYHDGPSRIAHKSTLKKPEHTPIYGDRIGYFPDVWWQEVKQ